MFSIETQTNETIESGQQIFLVWLFNQAMPYITSVLYFVTYIKRSVIGFAHPGQFSIPARATVQVTVFRLLA